MMGGYSFRGWRWSLAALGAACLLLGACRSAMEFAPGRYPPANWVAETEMDRMVAEHLREVGDRVPPLPAITGFSHIPRLPAPSLPNFSGKSRSIDLESVSAPEASAAGQAIGEPEYGIASWYAERWAWKKTASGEIYNPHSFTAAHRTLPFDSVVRVKNIENGASLLVRINNRGPFVKGRVIDLSPAAAKQLGFYNQGLTRVEVTRMRNVERGMRD